MISGMNKTRHPALFLATSLACAVHGQAPLAEQALQQSGMTESVVVPVAPPGDTVAASNDTVSLPVPAKDSAVAAAAVVVQPVPASPAAPPATDPGKARSRIRLLAGGTDWHWEESDDAGEIMLVEGGWFPGLRFEYARLVREWTIGLSVDAGAGAIEYDGAMQNIETDERTPYMTHTHYTQTTFDFFVFRSIVQGPVPIEVGARAGYHQWVRTIDSKKSEDPGEYGYVETWSHVSLQPVVAVTVPFGGSNLFRMEGGVRFGFSSEERITELGSGSIKPLLKPEPKPAIRANAMLKISHVLLEVEYLGLDFDKSPLWRKAIYQPDSYLDRLDVRVGWEF